MPQHVSGRFNFGASITEDGLNLVSGALRVTKPELFQKSDDIPIKADHTLRITAIADDPVEFNLYPIPSNPDLQPDTFFVRVKLKFSLTDSVLGLVTRIGVVLEAVGRFIQPVNPGEQLRIRVEKRPDGSDYLDIIDIEGDQPSVKLLSGAVDAGAAITAVYGDDDSQLGRTFRAVVNYLISLFLKDTLKRVVLEFPVPGLDKLVKFGPLGPVPIREVHAQNDALYVWMGDEEIPAPQPFPTAPVPSAHLRIGATETGLRRVVDASLPIPIPIQPASGAHITFRSEGLEVYKILFKLVPWAFPFPLPPGTPQIPGVNNIPVAIFIQGNIIIHVDFTVLGAHIAFDIPIPFDSLTSYLGSFVPVLTVDKPDVKDAAVTLSVVPATGFNDAWIAFIVTNYRGLFADAIRRKLDELKDTEIGKKICHVPVLGWIFCGIITLASKLLEVAAWLTGAALDEAFSPFFTVLVNVVVRLLRIFFDGPKQKLYSLAQSQLQDQLGLTISQAQINVIDNGRGGELLLEASFEGTGVPIPPEPPSPTPLPMPPPPNVPPPPGSDVLPEYGPGDFQPPYALPAPVFVDGATENFSLSVEDASGAVVATGQLQVVYKKTAAGWEIRQTTVLAGTPAQSVTTATYDAAFKPLESTSTDGAGISHSIGFLSSGYARAQVTFGSDTESTQVLLRGGVGQEFESIWIFRLGHSLLAPVANAVFSKIEISNPAAYVNWARQVPIKLSIVAGTVTLPGNPTPTPTWQINSADDENEVQFVCLQDGTAILNGITRHEGTVVRFTRA